MPATQEMLNDFECEEQRFDRHQKMKDEFDKKNFADEQATKVIDQQIEMFQDTLSFLSPYQI